MVSEWKVEDGGGGEMGTRDSWLEQGGGSDAGFSSEYLGSPHCAPL